MKWLHKIVWNWKSIAENLNNFQIRDQCIDIIVYSWNVFFADQTDRVWDVSVVPKKWFYALQAKRQKFHDYVLCLTNILLLLRHAVETTKSQTRIKINYFYVWFRKNLIQNDNWEARFFFFFLTRIILIFSFIMKIILKYISL